MQYELHSTYMLSSAFYPPSAFSHPRFILHPHFLIRVLSSIRIFSSAFYPPSAFSHPRFILHPHFLIRIFSSAIRIRHPYPHPYPRFIPTQIQRRSRIFAQEGPQRMLRGPTFADMTGHIIIISKYLFVTTERKCANFVHLFFY